MTNNGTLTVLAIPDYHAPFNHKDAYDFLVWVKRKYQPNKVVCLGDEADMHALSDYDHDPDGYSAGQELEKSIEELEKLYALFPNVMVCTSNHTARPFRKALKFGIPKAYLRDYHEFLRAPKGWSWADHWEVDGIRYEHGEGQSGPMGALKSALGNMQSTVIGHIHSHAGIMFSANEKHLVYGFNVGCLIDRQAYAMAYGKHHKSKPILGCGIITKGIPEFVPMLLDSRGRWVGR
jgi:hypothetical protein